METKSRTELDIIPGELRFVSAVKCHADADAIAKKRGYTAWYWDKRSCRIYGKVASTAKNVEGDK